MWSRGPKLLFFPIHVQHSFIMRFMPFCVDSWRCHVVIYSVHLMRSWTLCYRRRRFTVYCTWFAPWWITEHCSFTTSPRLARISARVVLGQADRVIPASLQPIILMRNSTSIHGLKRDSINQSIPTAFWIHVKIYVFQFRGNSGKTGWTPNASN